MPSNYDLTFSEALAKLEALYQRPIPRDYVNWLLDPNGPYPAPAEVQIPDESPWIDRIDMFYSVQQVLQTLQEDAENAKHGGGASFPSFAFPMGDNYGDYYLISLRDHDYGSVLFLFHETADRENDFRNGLITLSDSFAAWLPTLTPVPEDEDSPERCPECHLMGGHFAGCSQAASSSKIIGPYHHGCLSAWLACSVIFSAINVITTPFLFNFAKRSAPGLTHAGVVLICVLSLLNVMFAVALLRWKRWGFYGFLANSIAALVINLSIGLGLGSSTIGLFGVVILAILLNLGGNQRAWRHLK